MAKKESYLEQMKKRPLDLSPHNDESINLEYGMRVTYPGRKLTNHTTEMAIICGIEETTFTVERINPGDEDPNKFKVMLIPDDPIMFCKERVYSYILKKKIKNGEVKVL